jgi:hypothetical protein
MSGDRGVAKFNFNCGQYGVALSNGVFTATVSFYFVNYFFPDILVLPFYWYRSLFYFCFFISAAHYTDLRKKAVDMYYVTDAYNITRKTSNMLFFEHVTSMISLQVILLFPLMRDVVTIYLHHIILNIRWCARTKDLDVQCAVNGSPRLHWAHILWDGINGISSTIAS